MATNTSPRIALLSASDVNMILCGLRLLGATVDDQELDNDVPSEPDQLATGITLADIDRLLVRLATKQEMHAVCVSCAAGQHNNCAVDWIEGTSLVYCGCMEELCGQ